MRKVVSCRIKTDLKRKCYILSLEDVSDDGWSGGQTGAKIYKVGTYLVLTSWGNGIPIDVYSNVNDMIDKLTKRYGIVPEFVDINRL